MPTRMRGAGGLPLVTMAALLFLLASPLSAAAGGAGTTSVASQAAPGPAVNQGAGAASSANHSPIRIESDAAFNASNGVVSGTGTQVDPYIISGWSIQRNGTVSGILVANTTKHFTIAGVNVTGLDRRANGIVLKNLTNSSIRDTSVAGHDKGVSLIDAHGALVHNLTTQNVSVGLSPNHSNRTAVSNSTFRASTLYGINVAYSDNFTATGSTFEMISETGILFDSSYYFRVESSSFTGGRAGLQLSTSYHGIVSKNLLQDIPGDGMLIQSSNHITISNNTFVNNTIAILALISYYNKIDDNLAESCFNGLLLSNVYSSTLDRNRVMNSTVAGLQLAGSGLNRFRGNTFTGSYYDLDIRALPTFPETMENDFDMSNTVGGGPVFVARDVKDPKVPPGAGYVALVNVTGNVSGLNLSRQGQGVMIGFSDGFRLSDSVFARNVQGVSVVGSLNIIIENVTVADGYEAGLVFDGVRSSAVKDSRILGSNLSGIDLLLSEGNSISGNLVDGTIAGPALRLERDSHDNVIRGNVIRGSKSLGLEIADRIHGNEVSWNDFIANQIHAFDRGTAGENRWNGSDRGNYWSGHDATDENCDGAADLVFKIGAKGSQDSRPQVKPIRDSVKPCPPTGLKARSAGPEISLAWTAPSFDGDAKISKYNVYRRGSTGGYALVGSSNATKHADIPPALNATYFYRVTAVNSAGEGKNSTEAQARTYWVPPSLPDAEAQEILAEPARAVAGDAVRLRGVMVNSGAAALDSARARLLEGDAIGGTVLAESNVPRLMPGERFDLVATWRAVTGSHVFTLVMDQAAPAESDPTDNEASLVLLVEEKPGNGGTGGDPPPTERAAWSPILMSAAAGLLALVLVIAFLAMRKWRTAALAPGGDATLPAPSSREEEKSPDQPASPAGSGTGPEAGAGATTDAPAEVPQGEKKEA